MSYVLPWRANKSRELPRTGITRGLKPQGQEALSRRSRKAKADRHYVR
jgi:hypothetical protein